MMSMRGHHAVVLGASMGGLLAARVLADFYHSVTIIERDNPPEVAGNRRGVPQGRHIHLLWGRGSRVLDGLFPGFSAELIAAGAPSFDGDLSKIYINTGGHPLPPSGRIKNFSLLTPSRPMLECHVRRRLLALRNVNMLAEHDFVQPTCTAAQDRVTGALVRSHATGAQKELEADLVVDATGRGARTPTFLETMGYGRPAEDCLDVRLAYSSQSLRLPPDALRETAVIVGPVAGRPTGVGILRNENNSWMFTVSGMAGREPPSGLPEMFSYIEEFAPAHVVAAMREGEPLGAVVGHRLPTSRWRRYDKMRRFPRGLLVLGDAICSLNPIYGQGMTVAALEALALQRCLQRGEADLARHFFGAAAKIVDDAWQLATGADLSLPEVEGPRPLPVRIINNYVGRVQATAERDIVVAERLSSVVGLIERPGRLLSPMIMARVAGAGMTFRRPPSLRPPGAQACERATANRAR
ncbi:2-polyprenyl-6-methoxyphenol hydroxylase-like oxidoreductase [Mycobacterium paraseoulense]|uniref:2-polyprenyl-6-methoxyphenol hydroxylase-like oxidoreductase n=3 Tax=Mycobacteriaceae TaxID=1762 RepID=A0A1X0ID57_9MYCO|nr:2-polyprenyl-6-methoxyphenol hydroxylase-like oxidoreductase [Mycobacterium paraseoulense]